MHGGDLYVASISCNVVDTLDCTVCASLVLCFIGVLPLFLLMRLIPFLLLLLLFLLSILFFFLIVGASAAQLDDGVPIS